MKESTLIIISSPFQAICAIEAIVYFEVKEPYIIIIPNKENSINIKTYQILADYGINQYKIVKFDYFLKLLSYVISKKPYYLFYTKKFSKIIIGDYLNPTHKLLASYYNNNELIYLDDGNSSIEIFKYKSKLAKRRSINNFLKINISNILLHSRKKHTFFSVFPTKNDFFINKTNKLNFLKNKINIVDNRNDIYILGSNIYLMNYITGDKYIEYLKKTICSLNKNNTNSKIYYCPHRGENIKDIEKICEKLKLNIFQTQKTIEIDIVEKGIIPKIIVGFGSTALYTLKILFDEIQIYLIKLPTNNKNVNNTYNLIYKVYDKKNILILE